MNRLKQLVKNAYLDSNNNSAKSNDAISTSLNFNEFWSENESKFKNLFLSGVVKSLNVSLQINTKVKWKHVNGKIHKIVGDGFYQIKDNADDYIWQAYDGGSIKVID